MAIKPKLKTKVCATCGEEKLLREFNRPDDIDCHICSYSRLFGTITKRPQRPYKYPSEGSIRQREVTFFEVKERRC